MKKKLFLLLLIVALAAFVFTGCTPPAEGEGEGEGEGEIEGVLVEFAKEYRDGEWTYVAGGKNTVTVTFPAPVTGMVQINLSDCSGDYSKGTTYLFPNADRTVWTGSVTFECKSYYTNPCASCEASQEACCATTVTIISGACEADTCIAFPVIVDCDAPFAKLEISSKDCCCSECAISIKSIADPEGNDCGACPSDPVPCCGDYCSGLASWKVDVYKVKYSQFSGPNSVFEECCEISSCAKFVTSCEGEDCPIECTLDCIEEEEYYEYVYFAIITLKDNVGNKTVYYAGIELWIDDGECEIAVGEGCCVKNTGVIFHYADYKEDKEWKTYYIGGCKGETVCDDNNNEMPIP